MMFNSRTERLLNMLPWLVANPGKSLEDVAVKFETTKKQILDDLMLLTLTGPGEFGGDLVDIFYDQELISVRDSQGFNQPVKLSKDEAILISMLLIEILPQIPTQLTSAASQLINTLSAANVVEVFDPLVADGSSILDFIFAAIEKKKTIRFAYLSEDGIAPRIRTVSPWRVFIDDQKSYVIGYCHEALGTRSYLISKISKIDYGNLKYESPISNMPSSSDALIPIKARAKMDIMPVLELFPNFELLSSHEEVHHVSFGVYSLDFLKGFAIEHREFIRIMEPHGFDSMIYNTIRNFAS
jgi:predicted DNA-binding transcriptional regulator YafY